MKALWLKIVEKNPQPPIVDLYKKLDTYGFFRNFLTVLSPDAEVIFKR